MLHYYIVLMCDKKATAKDLGSEQMNYVSFDTQISIMNDAQWDSLVYRLSLFGAYVLFK